MAFVFESERKVCYVSRLIPPTGPGQYNLDIEFRNHPDAAPFKSSSRRQSMFERGGPAFPGPGQYNIAQPFIEPNIKTVSNSQSVIVKINSTGTSYFKSQRPRFEMRYDSMPGPGNYEVINADSSPRPRAVSTVATIHKENAATRMIKDLNKSMKNAPAIPEKVRGLSDGKGPDPYIPTEYRIGPGVYDPVNKQSINLQGTVWGKDRTLRFSVDQKIDLGPGKYHIDRRNTKASSADKSCTFKSSTVRTFFDSLIYNTAMEKTAAYRSKMHYKAQGPCPGQYYVNSSSFVLKYKPYSFQFFGSTVERFAYNYYPVDKPKRPIHFEKKSEIGDIKSFNKSAHAFLSESPRNVQFFGGNNANPGPGAYQSKVVVPKKLQGVKVERFGSTSGRPILQQDHPTDLGPGKYTQDDKKDSDLKNKFGQVSYVSHIFKSSTARECFGSFKDTYLLGAYDVSQNDMAKRVEKQRVFLENLKKIDVERAPFETSDSRFPHYEEAKKAPSNLTHRYAIKSHENKVREQQDKLREYALANNRNQLMGKEAKGAFPKTYRFPDGRKGAPGVGTYVQEMSWLGKSHNVKFQQK